MPSSSTDHREQSFAKDFASLKAIFEFISGFVVANGLNESTAFSAKFCAEEVFTNMVKYNPLRKDITISLAKQGNLIRMIFVDAEEKAFDITAREDVDVTLPLEQRNPGGLGIFLIRKMMDTVEYTHDGTYSRITLTKNLET
jgi:anti-sigma regulatory factor (Ser/Thr protein kinase)